MCRPFRFPLILPLVESWDMSRDVLALPLSFDFAAARGSGHVTKVVLITRDSDAIGIVTMPIGARTWALLLEDVPFARPRVSDGTTSDHN